MNKHIATVVGFILILMFCTFIFKNKPYEINRTHNNKDLNCLDNNINLTKIKKSLLFDVDYEELSSMEKQFIRNNKNEMYNLGAELFVKLLEENECDKKHFSEKTEHGTFFNCANGLYFKKIYDSKLIKKTNGYKISKKVDDLIFDFGQIEDKYNILNEYTGRNIIEEYMKFAVLGWEVARKLLNSEKIEYDEYSKLFNELKGLNVVRTINNITYPDFSILKENKTEYIFVTYVRCENDDEKVWNIDHKLDEAVLKYVKKSELIFFLIDSVD